MDHTNRHHPSLPQASSLIAKDHKSRRALRKSCNRCHDLKLRCDGSNVSRTPCQRCRRAFQTCVYSTRLAKLPKRNNSNNNNNNNNNKTRDYDMNGPRGDGEASEHPQQHHRPATGAEADLGDPLCFDFMIAPPLSVATDELSSWSLADWSSVMNASSAAAAAAAAGHPDGAPHVLGGSPGCEFTTATTTPDDLDEHDQDVQAQEPTTALYRISQGLGDILQSIRATWHLQSAQTYPVGQVFSIFSSLRDTLLSLQSAAGTMPHPRTSPPARGRARSSVLDDSQRGCATFLAATCYVQCVRIMTLAAEGLRGELVHRTAAEAEAAAECVSAGSHAAAAAIITTTTTTPDLVVGNVFLGLDPLGHAIASACATLRQGLTQLREIEAALGIPHPLGVLRATVTADPAATVDAGFPYVQQQQQQQQQRRRPGAKAPDPEAPLLGREEEEGEEMGSSRSTSRSTTSYISSATATRIVALLWEEEEELEAGAEAAAGSAVARLRECRADILRLAHENFISHYWDT